MTEKELIKGKVTTKLGLLYLEGELVDLPQADDLARQYGHHCVERFVIDLEEKNQLEPLTEKELIETLKKAKALKKSTGDTHDEAKDAFNQAEQAMLDHLDSIEASKTATYDGLGYAMEPTPRLLATCKVENLETLFKYLEEKERTDLIKTSVNSQSLSSFAKELVEEGEEIPSFISHYFKRSIRVY